jgi:hypothetical protein
VFFFLFASFLTGFLFPYPLFSLSFQSVTATPEEKILNPDPRSPLGTLTIYYSADGTGTVTISAPGASPQSFSYNTTGVTQTISLPATFFTYVNQFFPVTIRIQSGSLQAVTEVTIALDGTPPPPPENISVLPADSALLISWDPQIPYPPPFDRNVKYYHLYWSTQPLTSTIPITSYGEKVAYPDLNRSLSGASRVEVPFADHYLLTGLENGIPVYLTMEAFDHAGNRSGIPIFPDKSLVMYTGYPAETSGFSELTGVKDQCFIVTATFSPTSIWVKPYRWFRDRFLLYLPGGKIFVKLYYQKWGPAGAKLLKEEPLLRTTTQVLLLTLLPPIVLLSFLTPYGILFLLGGFFFLRWRRKKKERTISILLFFLFFHAQSLKGEESFSLRFSPFFAEELKGTAPNGIPVEYKDLYGSPRLPRIDLEYTEYPLRFVGLWGWGGSFGFGWDSGKALILKPEDGTFTRSGDSVLFLIFPATLFLRYRGEWLDEQWIVPTLTGGGEGLGWEERRRGGRAVESYAYGYFLSGEIELLLDWIDRNSAQFMEFNYGIRDTLLYGGLSTHRLQGPSSPSATLHFSHTTFQVGIRFVY